jgi:hypothetical protein
VEWPLAKFPMFIIRPVLEITSTEREADAEVTLHHYRQTAILNELLDNKRAVVTRPSHGAN